MAMLIETAPHGAAQSETDELGALGWFASMVAAFVLLAGAVVKDRLMPVRRF